MVEITAKINGMACGMCETHINDAVRNNFKVKKVTSSHSKAQTVIVAEEDIPDDKLKEVVEKAGYEFAGADRKPYVRKDFSASESNFISIFQITAESV